MEPEVEFALCAAVISGSFALVGALGSQVVRAFVDLRTKRLELLYKRKADAYQQFMDAVNSFALDPRDPQKYLAFLNSLETTLIFASDDVAEALAGKQGVNINAQRLRAAETDEEMQAVQVTTWYEAMKSASKAMRADMKSLSERIF